MYIPDLPTYLVFYLETTRGSSIDMPPHCCVDVLVCCQMYIPYLPTFLLFYLETTCGSFIDTPLPPMTTMTPTHFKSFYIPDSMLLKKYLVMGTIWTHFVSPFKGAINFAKRSIMDDCRNLTVYIFSPFLAKNIVAEFQI
jgi:hypothetical protein